MAKTQEMSAGLRRISALVQLLLLALIAYIIVKAIITYMSPEVAWKPVGAVATQSAPAAMAAPRNFDFSFNAFHRQQISAPVDTGEDAPETTLNLRLVGVTAIKDDSEAGTATLETADGNQKVYRVGTEIIDAVTLKAVYGDYVLISQSGQTERLNFERDDESALRSPAPAAVRAAIPAGVNPQVLAAFMNNASIKPIRKNGGTLGYKVLFRQGNFGDIKYGLKDEDVITHVNGVDMRQGSNGYGEMMSALQTGNAVNVKLLRNGQEMTVKVDLK